MPSVWVLHNSLAGQPGYARAVEQAAEAVARRGATVQVERRGNVADLRQVAREAVAAGADVVFAAGGDGTLGAIAGELAGSSVALGCLPAGTANVWAKVLGLPLPGALRPRALEQAALMLLDSPPLLTDLGRCNEQWFLVWAGMGLDAFVTGEYERQRQVSRRMGGWVYNFALTFLVARSWHGVDLRLRVSGPAGRREISGHYLMATVCNIGYHGGGLFQFADDFRLDDGLMDVWAFEGSTYAEALGMAASVLRGLHLQHPSVHRLTGDRLEFEAAVPQAIQTDAEPQPPSPRLSVQVAPRSVRVLVPRARASRLYLNPRS
jgi:diacylglycerol kinase (ATP)